MLNTRSKLSLANLLLRNVRQLHCSSARRLLDPEPGKAPTVADINDTTDSKFIIKNCFINGFYLSNGLKIRGPVVLFPRSILLWNIANSMSINEASLSLFTIIEPKVELLIIGVEEQLQFHRILNIQESMKRHKISVEILPVEHACTVYNIKCHEDAYVAAALIPPTKRPKVLTYIPRDEV